MVQADRWLLPDGVEELLPGRAAQAEGLRRRLLDLFQCWGYELVMPSLIEYTDSLLIGLGDDVDLHTFKVTDQLSGRLLGIRPDITPQAARIDAHALNRQGAVRLCYAGSVLHTRPRGEGSSRSPIQVGAELYGEPGIEADIEVVSLMLETLRLAGASELTLDLGHQRIVTAVLETVALDDETRQDYFAALQSKAEARIRELVTARVAEPGHRDWLIALAELHGGPDTLEQAAKRLAGAPSAVAAALAELGAIAGRLQDRFPLVEFHFDLAELHGYHYHTGLVFAAYHRDCGQAVANGGRYDDIGQVFGRARPATGFNADLKTLLNLMPAPQSDVGTVFAPWSTEPDWWAAVQSLREAGRRVICGLTATDSGPEAGNRLVRRDDGWRIEEHGNQNGRK